MVRLLACVAVTCAAFASAAERPASEADLDAAFREATVVLERRAREAGAEALATLIREWNPPAPAGRLVVFDLPAGLIVPPGVGEPAVRAVWDDFVATRRQRANGLFALGIEAARAHARPPAFAAQGCEALRLLSRALHDDPDHDRGRRAGGWVRRGDEWVWPEVRRRLDKGEEYSADRGWLSPGRKKRNRDAAATDRAGPPAIDRAPIYASDHWLIRSTAGLDAAARLAADLEMTRAIWLQVFGAFQCEPAELERRFEGRGRVIPLDPFRCMLLADRAHYVAELESLEPLIAKTLGIYWTPTRTSWFFIGPEQTPTTIHHEATHQLFGEMRKTSPLAGERCGFWAIEAAACFMESLTPAAHGWTLGGPDAGRVPIARERLLEDGFYVPLEELAAMGRQQLQADERLPQIYSQISGLGDFFMTAEQGRYREAFVEYLARVYTGTVDPDTLARLCGRSYADLDDAYRRHMAR